MLQPGLICEAEGRCMTFLEFVGRYAVVRSPLGYKLLLPQSKVRPVVREPRRREIKTFNRMERSP